MNLTEARIERETLEIPLYGKQTYKARMYNFDGIKGVSVSSACSVIVKLELQQYFKNNSIKKQEEHLKKTSSIGSDIHSLIEREANGEEIKESEKEGLEESFNIWKDTEEKYQITEEMSETFVFSKTFGYGGTIDRIGSFNGKRCIIDWKTGRYSHINLWKTEAYRQAYIEMTGDTEIGAVVVHLPRPDLIERGEKARHYTISQHTSCMLAFLSSYQTFKMLYYKNLLDAGMTREQVFQQLPFTFYEREFGAGNMKGMK